MERWIEEPVEILRVIYESESYSLDLIFKEWKYFNNPVFSADNRIKILLLPFFYNLKNCIESTSIYDEIEI